MKPDTKISSGPRDSIESTAERSGTRKEMDQTGKLNAGRIGGSGAASNKSGKVQEADYATRERQKRRRVYVPRQTTSQIIYTPDTCKL